MGLRKEGERQRGEILTGKEEQEEEEEVLTMGEGGERGRGDEGKGADVEFRGRGEQVNEEAIQQAASSVKNRGCYKYKRTFILLKIKKTQSGKKRDNSTEQEIQGDI